jgi:hypothetical protein
MKQTGGASCRVPLQELRSASRRIPMQTNIPAIFFFFFAALRFFASSADGRSGSHRTPRTQNQTTWERAPAFFRPAAVGIRLPGPSSSTTRPHRRLDPRGDSPTLTPPPPTVRPRLTIVVRSTHAPSHPRQCAAVQMGTSLLIFQSKRPPVCDFRRATQKAAGTKTNYPSHENFSLRTVLRIVQFLQPENGKKKKLARKAE